MQNISPTLYLIDASIYIFRAWFSTPPEMRGADGQPVNAAYGFARFLTEFSERTQAEHVAIAFDESLTTSFRNELYPEYKMNRELPPEALKNQFRVCRELAEAAGFYCVSHTAYEADDLIATLASRFRADAFKAVVVSGDKDLTQVLQARDIWWDFARNRRLDAAGVELKFGVPPSAIQDYLGLCGDAVDNIPGVPGVGPKTAIGLLQAFNSMEGIYEALSKIKHLPIRGAKTLAQKLSTHEEQAFLSKQLATVSYSAPIATDQNDIRRHQAEVGALKEIQYRLGGRGEGLFSRLTESSRAFV